RLLGGAAIAGAEEERDRHFECLGDALQASRTDAVHTLLVFLDLLERHPDAFSELSLRKAAFQPPRTYAPTDFRVAVVGTSRAHVLVEVLGLFHELCLLPSWRSLYDAWHSRVPRLSLATSTRAQNNHSGVTTSMSNTIFTHALRFVSWIF